MRKSLGEIIHEERTGNPLFRTKKSLADAVGVSLEYIRRIENGSSVPSGEVLDKIVTALDMSGQIAQRCWRRLAEHQLDDQVLMHVSLKDRGLTNGQVERVAHKVAEWMSLYYALDEEEGHNLEQEVTQLLRG